MWLSISRIFSMLLGSMREEVTLFSTASNTPSAVLMPTAVDPSWEGEREGGREGGRGKRGKVLGLVFQKALLKQTLMASIAYST